MGKAQKLKERLEDFRATNIQIQGENQHLKERIAELEKDLAKMFPLLKEHFVEC